MSELFEALLSARLPEDPSVSMSKARRDVDGQLKESGGELLQVRKLLVHILQYSRRPLS